MLSFAAPATLAQACATAGLGDIGIEQRRLCLRHADLPTLLRGLKVIGANQISRPRRPGLLGRQAWRAIEARYEARRDDAGLPATYEVVLCTARKAIS